MEHRKPSLLIASGRPTSCGDALGAHLPLALICGTVLLLSVAVPVDKLPLMGCTFLHLTGYPCPFCGFTRSFWALGHGNWEFGLANCPLAVPAYGVLLWIFLWNAVPLGLGIRVRRGRLLRLWPWRLRWALVSVLVLLLLNWLYRLEMGLK